MVGNPEIPNFQTRYMEGEETLFSNPNTPTTRPRRGWSEVTIPDPRKFRIMWIARGNP